MKKSIMISIGMAVILFLYGYIITNVGHDHNAHSDSHNAQSHNH